MRICILLLPRGYVETIVNLCKVVRAECSHFSWLGSPHLQEDIHVYEWLHWFWAVNSEIHGLYDLLSLHQACGYKYLNCWKKLLLLLLSRLVSLSLTHHHEAEKSSLWHCVCWAVVYGDHIYSWIVPACESRGYWLRCWAEANHISLTGWGCNHTKPLMV